MAYLAKLFGNVLAVQCLGALPLVTYFKIGRVGSDSVVECLGPDRGFEPHRCHCVVSLSKNINPSLVLVQPRKTCPFITDRLLIGCKGNKESNETLKAVQAVHVQCLLV